MENFTSIKHDSSTYRFYRDYVISNLGNMRRIGTDKNLRKYKKGFFSDTANTVKILYEDIGEQILDLQNIKKLYVMDNTPISNMQSKYKEIIMIIYARNYDTTKMNIPFRVVKLDQLDMTRGTSVIKNPKMPYGSKVIINKKEVKYGFKNLHLKH